ncbi:hypothetical protein EJB05_45275, partial [Eragrostis curvula]
MGLSYGKQHPSSPWPDLPPELAGLIMCRLRSHTDRLSFMSVCRPWRLAGQQHHPLHDPLPWLRLRDRFFQSLPGGDLRLLKLAMDAHHSSPGYLDCFDSWLFISRFNDGSGTRFLINPSSGRLIRVPQLRFRSGCTSPRKMIVCSPDDLVAASSYDSSKVAFYRPGAVSWSLHRSTSTLQLGRYTDMAFHRGKLYVVTIKEELLVLSVAAAATRVSRACHVEHVIKGRQDQVATRLYLVASCGKLLMVKITRCIGYSSLDQASCSKFVEKIVLDVFEADLVMGRWLEVKALDCGQALFVGRGGSKAVTMTCHDDVFQGNRPASSSLCFRLPAKG